jgi:hypothetical protein
MIERVSSFVTLLGNAFELLGEQDSKIGFRTKVNSLFADVYGAERSCQSNDIRRSETRVWAKHVYS